MPKGEKVLAQSKRTAPPPISKSISILISKTLLNTERRISLRGSFV
jgi:hypothetical protein